MSDDPSFGPRTIRPSSLTTAVDCDRRWAARHMRQEIQAAGYELRQTGPLHVGAAVGSGVHAAAAFTLDALRATGEIGNAAEAEDRAVAEFSSRTEFGVDWDETTSDLPTAKRQLQRMTRSYRHHLAPSLTPLLVEHRLVSDAGDGWSMSGQADTMCGNPDQTIRDLKTGARRRANGVQYGAYAMIFKSHGYELRGGMVEDFLGRVRLAHDQPAPVTYSIPMFPAVEGAWAAIQSIKANALEFERRLADATAPAPHGAFRANPASSLCAARWCPAWGTLFCQAHA